MKVYSSYYGASSSKPIGFQAQSKEIEGAVINDVLKDLSALRPISAIEKADETLMYMVKSKDAVILGISYTEAASSSGYNRSAPCGLQYVLEDKELDAATISRTLNFAVFKKPDSANPPVLEAIPESENGYYYKNAPAATAAVVDALVKALLSGENKPVLVALPQTKGSRYAMARYTVSEIVSCLPADLRSRVSFFSDLPIVGESGDAPSAFDKAIAFGANLIFCQADALNKLNGRRAFVPVDMNRPEKAAAYASLVARSGERSQTIGTVSANVQGDMSYESLNSAAQQVASGNVATVKELKDRLSKSEKEAAALKTKYDKDTADLKAKYSKDVGKLQAENEKLKSQKEELDEKYDKLKKSGPSSKKKSPIDKKLIIIAAICAALLIAITAIVTYLISRPSDSGSNVETRSPLPGQVEEIKDNEGDKTEQEGALTEPEIETGEDEQKADMEPAPTEEANKEEEPAAAQADENEPGAQDGEEGEDGETEAQSEIAPETTPDPETNEKPDDAEATAIAAVNPEDETEQGDAKTEQGEDSGEAADADNDADKGDLNENNPDGEPVAPVVTDAQAALIVISDLEELPFGEEEQVEFQSAKIDEIDLSAYDEGNVIVLLYDTQADLSKFDGAENVYIIKYVVNEDGETAYEYDGEKYASLEKIMEVILPAVPNEQ